MDTFATTLLFSLTALAVAMCMAAVGLNNNANNNTRHYGWAGV
ncbi:hypothetical protein ACFFJT_17615 [Dyella flava]|nr:hypothetical protein [Dyella flava]